MGASRSFYGNVSPRVLPADLCARCGFANVGPGLSFCDDHPVIKGSIDVQEAPASPEPDYFANNLLHLQEIGDRLREDADRLEAEARRLRSRASAIDGAKVNLNRYRVRSIEPDDGKVA